MFYVLHVPTNLDVVYRSSFEQSHDARANHEMIPKNGA